MKRKVLAAKACWTTSGNSSCLLAVRAKLWRLRIFWRARGSQDVDYIFLRRVGVGLDGDVLRNPNQVAIRKRVLVALHEFFRDIGAERQRAITGSRAEQRGTFSRLDPSQEPLPVRFLK